MRSDASFSEDRRFRYWLLRVWDESLPKVCYIALNPSTADETNDDPTIRREIAFAKRDGFGGILKLNLYAYRSTSPSAMWKAEAGGIDIIGGSLNWCEELQGYARKFGCKTVIACWGRHGKKRGAGIIQRWPGLKCFGLNDDGTPKHPLYLSGDTEIIDLPGRQL